MSKHKKWWNSLKTTQQKEILDKELLKEPKDDHSIKVLHIFYGSKYKNNSKK